MIRILIADDHPVVRAGLRLILEDEPRLQIVGEARDGDECLAMLQQSAADILLLDIGMPGAGFLEILRQVRGRPSAPRVLVLSIYPEEQYALRAIRAGAAGYLSKDHSPEQLVRAILHVHSGRRYVSSTLAEWMAARLSHDVIESAHEALSDRELQVLSMIGSGSTVTEVAASLALSVKTVSTYRTRIRAKLGLKSTADMIRYAISHDLVT